MRWTVAVPTLAALTLVLPTFSTSTRCPEFSTEQLAFAAVASLALYLLFVFVQTVRHRGDFLPADADADDPDEHADPPSSREALLSLGMLVVGLAAVVGLATVVSPAIEDAVAAKSDRRQKQTVTTPDEGQSHRASLGVQTAKEGWHDDTLRDRP